MNDEPIRVEAYAGASYPQRPMAVWRDDQRYEVLSVHRSWRTPQALHYLVEVAELGSLQLRYRIDLDTWFKC